MSNDKRTIPRHVRAFKEHGVDLKAVSGGQWQGQCPFCGKAEKFRSSPESGLWDCKVCGETGNLITFLAKTAEESERHLKGKRGLRLGKDRRLKLGTLRAWGVGWNPRTGSYTIPQRGNPRGSATNLVRYSLEAKGGRRSVGTTCGTLSLFAPKRRNQTADTIYLMEGEWDGMAAWQELKEVGTDADVLALPGALNLPKSAEELFMGKRVICVFDADSAGVRGAHKAARQLSGVASELLFARWPAETPDGYDFRDLARDVEDPLGALEKMLKPDPPESEDVEPEDLAEAAKTGDAAGIPTQSKTKKELADLVGQRPSAKAATVYKHFRQHLHMTSCEPLDVMFGAVLANRLEGDPLWMFLVAPPGGMKTELLMSLMQSPLITMTTSITPHTLVSGANFAGGGDPSLLPKLDKRVLVIKDFTTIMSMNAQAKEEIFGILRDAYDGRTDKQFGNGIVRSYEAHFGVLAGVTPAIEQFNSNSVLGERFIKYRMTSNTKVDVGRNAIRQALQNIGTETTMRDDLQKAAAKALTREVERAEVPALTDEIIDRITELAQWVARLRGVVTRDQYRREQVQSKPCAEIGTRLAKQLAKLALGISLYKQEEEISDETYRTIAKVAADTAPDRVEEITKQLYILKPDEWWRTEDIAERTRFPTETARFVLEDLAMLRIVDYRKGRNRGNWRLARSVTRLMDSLELYTAEKAWAKVRERKRGRRV